MTVARSAFRAAMQGLSAGLLVLILAVGVAAIGLPAVVGGMPLSVLTGSMQPSLPPGSLVVVKPTPMAEIGIGDVVTYQLHSGQPLLVTHRVVGRSVDSATGGTRLITQGDANTAVDPEPVMPVQVRGTVWYALPYLGWANQALSGTTRSWVIPAVAGVLFVYAGAALIGGIRDRRRARAAATTTASVEASSTTVPAG